jgi:uncharacterized membrane protein
LPPTVIRVEPALNVPVDKLTSPFTVRFPVAVIVIVEPAFTEKLATVVEMFIVQGLFEVLSNTTLSFSPGTIFPLQFAAVDQLLSAPPPSQTNVIGTQTVAPLDRPDQLEASSAVQMRK